MTINNGPIEVSLCMGSSCFSRGNNRMVQTIQDFVRERGLENRVIVKGHLCEGLCKDGPHVRIDGQLYSCAEPACVLDVLAGLVE